MAFFLLKAGVPEKTPAKLSYAPSVRIMLQFRAFPILILCGRQCMINGNYWQHQKAAVSTGSYCVFICFQLHYAYSDAEALPHGIRILMTRSVTYVPNLGKNIQRQSHAEGYRHL